MDTPVLGSADGADGHDGIHDPDKDPKASGKFRKREEEERSRNRDDGR
jgi:hypothetical protein